MASKERETRRVAVGPHRDRLRVLWNGVEASQVASAGERKTLGLLLLLAQARVLSHSQREPLLLIDDADIELDEPTLMHLWPRIRGFSQVLASSNRPSVWREIEVDSTQKVEAGLLLEKAL